MSAVLTEKNRRAIDLYLSGEEPFAGNGTACWQEVYGTRNKATAAANWARMLGNASARAYLTWRQGQIDALKAEELAYAQADAVRDLLAIQRSAMEMVCVGRVIRKVKRKHPETGKEVVDIEYEPVMGMRDLRAAIAATNQLLRVQGKHPDQNGGAYDMNVSVCINGSRLEADAPLDVTPDNGYEVPAQSHGGGAAPAKPLPKVVQILRNTSTLGRESPVELYKQAVPAVIIG
ncbi:MAG: hypothetical protein U5R46_02110 [Gammaproteobacteria bacterium]|nr:hypothetical protein [Gammaproteobacteria bacterium]